MGISNPPPPPANITKAKTESNVMKKIKTGSNVKKSKVKSPIANGFLQSSKTSMANGKEALVMHPRGGSDIRSKLKAFEQGNSSQDTVQKTANDIPQPKKKIVAKVVKEYKGDTSIWNAYL